MVWSSETPMDLWWWWFYPNSKLLIWVGSVLSHIVWRATMTMKMTCCACLMLKVQYVDVTLNNRLMCHAKGRYVTSLPAEGKHLLTSNKPWQSGLQTSLHRLDLSVYCFVPQEILVCYWLAQVAFNAKLRLHGTAHVIMTRWPTSEIDAHEFLLEKSKN